MNMQTDVDISQNNGQTSNPNSVQTGSELISNPAPYISPGITGAAKQSNLTEPQDQEVKMNAQNITSAYKIFLNRVPENMQVVNERIDKNSDEILSSFMNAPGFLNKPFFRTLILTLAKEIKQAYEKKSTPT